MKKGPLIKYEEFSPFLAMSIQVQCIILLFSFIAKSDPGNLLIFYHTGNDLL